MNNPLQGSIPNPFTACKVVAVDVDPADYHRQEPGIERGNPVFVQTRSCLMDFRRDGPSKWRATTREKKDTDATDFGTLQDVRAMTPHRLEQRYVLTPATCTATKTMKIVKTGKAAAGDPIPWNAHCAEAKEWKEAQEYEGKIVLDADQYADSNEALKRLSDDERISELFACSDKQVLIVGEYRDTETGLVIPVKTLIDLKPRTEAEGIFLKSLADFKTARRADPGSWPFAVDERDYDAQAAMSLWLAGAAEPERDWQGFLHAGQENTHPFEPFRRWLDMEFIELGRLKILTALKSYCACLAANQWPGWDDTSSFPGMEGWGQTSAPFKALMREEKQTAIPTEGISTSNPVNQDPNELVTP